MTAHMPSEKVLLVEGATELRLLPHLMEANGVLWPNARPPVVIRNKNGFENIIDRRVIEAEVYEPFRKITGILLDADKDLDSRWKAIQQVCVPYFPSLSQDLPTEGIIVSNSDTNHRLGIWIMPNNRSSGMLEDLLTFLVPSGKSDPVYAYAEESCDFAKAKGATFKDNHLAKARIHTWLAWQDEPGRQLHDAVKFRLLDPKSENAQPFVKWFRELFDV